MAECILQKTGDSREIYKGGVFLPTTEDQVIVPPEGAVEEAVVLAGDPNLLPKNIRKNVALFGVKGTFNNFVAEEDYYLDGGNRCIDVTGDYVASGSGAKWTETGLSIDITSTTYEFNGGDSSKHYKNTAPGGFFKTGKKLDMTDKKNIYITATGTMRGKHYPTGDRNYNKLFVYFVARLRDDANNVVAQCSQDCLGSISSITGLTFNVLNVVGEYYLELGLYYTFAQMDTGSSVASRNQLGSQNSNVAIKTIRWDNTPTE